MEPRTSNRKTEHSRALEEAYRRGYHHGLSQAMDLIFGLQALGIPTSATSDLCRFFEQQVVIPWRSTETQSSSPPPRFGLEECQRFLRALKAQQSE